MNSSFFSGLTNRFRYGHQLNPARDWLVLLTLWLILFAGVVGWNAWAFDTVAGGGTIGAAASSTPPIFNQSSLDSIRVIFDTRVNEELKYTTGVYHFADPSQ